MSITPAALDELDAMERKCLAGREADAKLRERRNTVRHNAFAAGLVDGRQPAVSQQDGESGQPGGNRRRQPCRSTSGYENVLVVHGQP